MPNYQVGDIVVCTDPGPPNNYLLRGGLYTVTEIGVFYTCVFRPSYPRENDRGCNSDRFRLATLVDLFPARRPLVDTDDPYAIEFNGSAPPAPPAGFEWVPFLDTDPNTRIWIHMDPRSSSFQEGFVVNDLGRRVVSSNQVLLRLHQIGAPEPRRAQAQAARPRADQPIVSRQPPVNVRRATIQPLPLP